MHVCTLLRSSNVATLTDATVLADMRAANGVHVRTFEVGYHYMMFHNLGKSSGRAINDVKVREAIDKKRSELERVTADVRHEYYLWTDVDHDQGSNYFVLFRKHRQCNIAKQVVNTRNGELEVLAAPLVSDVCWRSLC